MPQIRSRKLQALRVPLTLGLLAVLVSACTFTFEWSGPTTTFVPPTTTFVSDNGRTVEAVDCDSAPETVIFLCEAYELITGRFVDPLDTEEMAEATTTLITEMEPQGELSDPVLCALPDPAFVATCEAAAELGLDSVETAEVIINSLVYANLDANSAYLDPQELDRVLEAESPNFAGIGAQVRAEDLTLEGDDKQCNVISETCLMTIVATLEDHPARAAGLLADDVVTKVDGRDIVGLSVDDVVAAVRGPVGEAVTLTVVRETEELDITIVRDLIRVPVIEAELIDGIGYVRLYDFSSPAAEQFEEAVLDLLADGATRLVFDLRYNPGGLLDVAIDVTSVFLPDGEVVVTQSPDRTTPYRVTGRSIVPADMRVDVVVNRASASASEVVSAVLQERGRAKVYGENSFGKNTVQQRWNLSNGGAMKVTTARWLTPGGLNFGSVGVTPDVALEIGQDATAADVVNAVLAAD